MWQSILPANGLQPNITFMKIWSPFKSDKIYFRTYRSLFSSTQSWLHTTHRKIIV